MVKHEVAMPVIAIGEQCLDCPDIKIGVAQKTFDIPCADDDRLLERHYENTLYCEHYERCRLIRTMIMKGNDK